MESLKEQLAKNLKIARKHKGWTLQEVENLTGIKIVTLGSYERGFRLPPVDTLARLASQYEVSTSWLIGEVN